MAWEGVGDEGPEFWGDVPNPPPKPKRKLIKTHCNHCHRGGYEWAWYEEHTHNRRCGYCNFIGLAVTVVP